MFTKFVLQQGIRTFIHFGSFLVHYDRIKYVESKIRNNKKLKKKLELFLSKRKCFSIFIKSSLTCGDEKKKCIGAFPV